MKYYRSYMDRQEISPEVHEKLLNLSARRKTSHHLWVRYGALAACAALVLGIGAWKLPSVPGVDDPPILSDIPAPEQTKKAEPLESDAAQGQEDSNGFLVNSSVEGDKLAFPAVPGIAYQDISYTPDLAASRAFAPGTFTVELTMEDIQGIFWGPEGKPEADHPKLEQGSLPWALFWDGYTVHGIAWYDGQGKFTELTIWGEKDRASFNLKLRLGALPFTCLVDPDRETSEFNGVEITGWSRVYDRDGDGQTDYICGSEFMTESSIGVRFENQNSSMRAEYGGGSDMELGGSCTFNALFVRQALSNGLYLDHLLTADSIPAWRDVKFDTLEQARQEADFAPYLPTKEPDGYGAYTGVNRDFFGRLSYQEGHENMLFVRWSWEYDTVEVDVHFPEGETAGHADPVDINVPESYDTRLYQIPWCDSVPEEYRADFYSVTFRAEDMSLDAVRAREVPHDTGGVSFHFRVLHPNGVVVSYTCDGMTAQQVWDLVKETLP